MLTGGDWFFYYSLGRVLAVSSGFVCLVGLIVALAGLAQHLTINMIFLDPGMVLLLILHYL